MTSPSAPRPTLPPEMVTSLLRTAQRVRERGDLARARSLLRALAEQAPGDWQVWQALADVAESDAERMAAIEHLAALAAPRRPRVTERLDRPRTTQDQRPSSKDQEVGAEGPLAGAERAWHAPELSAQNYKLKAEAAPPPGWFRGHWLTYAALGLLALLVLAAALLLRDRLPAQTAAQLTPTPPLATAAPAGAPAPPGTGVLHTPTPAPTTAPAPTAALTPAPVESAPPPTAAPASDPALPTAPPATAAPALPIGQVVDRGDWSVTVLRPEHLVPLSGSIGGLAPQGRFVLALVAVSNRGPAPAPLPSDMLALVDASGRRFDALPAASTAYLAAYGRGQRGDLSMEEAIPPGAGIVSVPLIFDVPPDAAGLALTVGGEAAGWPVGR